MKLIKEREELIKYANLAITEGLTKGTGGNFSIYNREEGLIAITPSGVPYADLVLDDIVIVDINGTTVEGNLKPSSEIEMHLSCYRAYKGASAFVHVHSKYATAYSTLRKPLPAIDYLIAFGGGKIIPVADYALYGSKEIAMNSTKTLKGYNACLLANHGLNTYGDSMYNAYAYATQLEFCAQTYVLAKCIGEPVIISDKEMEEMLSEMKTYGQNQKS